VESRVQGRKTETKAIVVIAVEIKHPKGFGRIRLKHVPDVTAESLLLGITLLAPVLVVVGTGIVVLLIDLIVADWVSRRPLMWISTLGLLVGIATCGLLWQAGYTAPGYNTAFGGFLVLDGFALFFEALFMLSAILVILSATTFADRQELVEAEFYIMVLFSTAGLMLMASGNELMSIYLAIDPSVYRRGLLHLVPRRLRGQTEEILSAIVVTLRKWLVTQLIAMIVIGVVTTVVLMALKVRAAVPLGILAGLLEFVPNLGPVLSSLPAIAMGFVDSPQKALAVAIAYVGIQFIENHLLIPILMKQGLNLPPALTIVMQSLMALIFGVLGLLVAVPLLAAIVIATQILTNHEGVPGAMPATTV